MYSYSDAVVLANFASYLIKVCQTHSWHVTKQNPRSRFPRTRRTTRQLILQGDTELRRAAEDKLSRGKETLHHSSVLLCCGVVCREPRLCSAFSPGHGIYQSTLNRVVVSNS